jgi:hypothetical protein
MKVSFNDQWIGRPIKDQNNKLWHNGKQVYPGYQWSEVDESFETIFNALTVTGLAIGPVVKDGHRNRENFISHSIALVDIDKGMTIEELLTNDFYLKYGSGYYTSPSYTEEHHKFRIIFVLDDEITDIENLRHLYIGLMMVFECADTNCKDGSRLFYGSINAPRKEMTNRTLPSTMVKGLIKLSRDEAMERWKTVDITKTYDEPSDAQKQKIIELLKRTFVGDYEIWRTIGWGLKQGGYSVDDFIYVTDGMMNQKSAQAARELWNTGSTSGPGVCTMGTVKYWLQKVHGKDCLKEDKQEWINNKREAAKDKMTRALPDRKLGH